MIFGFSACTKEQAEKESVSDAYTFFINWAVSGGANYTNWYKEYCWIQKYQ